MKKEPKWRLAEHNWPKSILGSAVRPFKSHKLKGLLIGLAYTGYITCGTSKERSSLASNGARANKGRRPTRPAGMSLSNSWLNAGPSSRSSEPMRLHSDTETFDSIPRKWKREIDSHYSLIRAGYTCPLKWAPTSNKMPSTTTKQRKPNLPLTRALSFLTRFTAES